MKRTWKIAAAGMSLVFLGTGDCLAAEGKRFGGSFQQRFSGSPAAVTKPVGGVNQGFKPKFPGNVGGTFPSKPLKPVSPVVGPLKPIGPMKPVGPVKPFPPLGPIGPIKPPVVGPVKPLPPFGPIGPIGPIKPPVGPIKPPIGPIGPIKPPVGPIKPPIGPIGPVTPPVGPVTPPVNPVPPVCPPYQPPCGPWWGGWCYSPCTPIIIPIGGGYGGGYTNVVTETVIVEVPAPVVVNNVAPAAVVEPAKEEKLMQVPVGATLTLNGKELGDKPGQVLLQFEKFSFPAQVGEWKPDQVTATLPQMGLAAPTKVQIFVMKENGEVATTLAVELVPAAAK